MAEYELISEIECPKCGYKGFDDDREFWYIYPLTSMRDGDIESVECKQCGEEFEIIADEKITTTFSNNVKED